MLVTGQAGTRRYLPTWRYRDAGPYADTLLFTVRVPASGCYHPMSEADHGDSDLVYRARCSGNHESDGCGFDVVTPDKWERDALSGLHTATTGHAVGEWANANADIAVVDKSQPLGGEGEA